MAARREQNYLKGAAILTGSVIASKIIGAIYKIPLQNMLGEVGSAHHQLIYTIYTLLLTLSYSGIPVALSRLVSVSEEKGNTRQTAKYFKVALPAFAFVGAVASILMFIFAPQLASFMENPLATLGIRVISPAVFLCCVISVFEGFAQGHGDMIPTAIKQVLEVLSKLVIGICVVWFLTRQGAELHVAAAGAVTGSVVGLALVLPILIWYKKRKFSSKTLSGEADTAKDTLKAIAGVSIPIALGASFMNVLTLIDSKVVMMRLMDGVGLTREAALGQYGIYSRCLTLFNLLPALMSSITVSSMPAIASLAQTGRGKEARTTTESAIKMVCLIAIPAGIGIAVLAEPIYGALFGSHDGTQLLRILGIAAVFACTQLITTAILQANGHERVPMISFFIGGVVQLVCDWILVGNPDFGIVGSPIGTLSCYLTITVINIVVIFVKVKRHPRFFRAAKKPFFSAVVMGVAAFSVCGLTQKLLGNTLGTGRSADIIYTGVSVFVGVVVYFVMVIATRTLTKSDLELLPKGKSLARLLRIKE